MTTMKPKKNKLSGFLAKSKVAFAYAFGFSFILNILTLAMSLYSLQVLDRVLSSNSIETLLMLSILMIIIFIIHAAIQMVRSFIFLQISQWMDQKLSALLLQLSVNFKTKSAGAQHLRDLATLKSFVTGPAITHMFDAPWAIIFLAVIFFIHPLNGWVTVAGALSLVILTWVNEVLTKHHLKKANEKQIVALNEAEALTRNAEIINAMGMMTNISNQWQPLNDAVGNHTKKAAKRASIVAAITKSIRMCIQMMTMAVGAVLVISNQMSAGGIIATSILAGKALAPFDAALTIWKSWVSSKKAYSRLNSALNNWADIETPMTLPVPTGQVTIEKCAYKESQLNQLIIKGVNISFEAGQCIGIVGSSGSGKTTLARLLTGVLMPTHGSIRLDGADIETWDKTELGQHIGYLPQDIELFSGSIQDNIARMNQAADSEMVLNATKFTETHDLILTFSKGYNTRIGSAGQHLSAGQRQRIALARAFFGSPKLVVLDEPNSNLDADGEAALSRTIERAKAQRITTCVISHKPDVLNLADYILVMHQGEAKLFDERDTVLPMISAEKKSHKKDDKKVIAMEKMI